MAWKDESAVAVTATRRVLVTAAMPVQESWLPMSNLDLLLPPEVFGAFFFYRKAVAAVGGGSIISVLEKSLSETLKIYYPFAGEVTRNAEGELGVLCNNRGVDFIEARCQVSLASLHFRDPQDSVMKALMPEKKDGVLTVQATELKCGGLVVACSFDHRVADGYSADMFFVSWAEAARSVPFSSIPSFNRSLLSPNTPSFLDDSIGILYVPMSKISVPPNIPPTAASVERIYYIAAADITRNQELASSHPICRRTKLEAFTAYLWHVLGRVQATGSPCSMGVTVNGRQRMSSSMETYFGNVLSIPFATIASEELRAMKLDEVANVVHECISRAATPDHFIGLIHWVQEHLSDPLMSKICAGIGGNNGVDFVISSGLRFSLSTVNFGWGKPVFASYTFPWSCPTGYVMPVPSTLENGDWVVYIHMAAEQVTLMETAAGDIFRPVTADYLGLSHDT